MSASYSLAEVKRIEKEARFHAIATFAKQLTEGDKGHNFDGNIPIVGYGKICEACIEQPALVGQACVFPCPIRKLAGVEGER